MHFYTSITINYLPKARVLASSLKRYCQNSWLTLVVSDELPSSFDLSSEPFDEVWSIEDLAIPVSNLNMWIFQHTVVELCTAVKGQALVRILEEGRFDKAIYLDPDTAVFDDLSELVALLDEHDVVLTPHLTAPEKTLEGIWDNEVCALQHGTYNLGFVAIKNSPNGRMFAYWWRDRLVELCRDDIPNGIFTDQRWVDLAPAIFDGIHIERSPAYNVSTWNLSNRKVTQKNGRYFINEKPLQFYHFSGFDSGANESMMQKYGDTKETWALRNWYVKAQNEAGQKELGSTPGKYNVYSNGQLIPAEHRVILRTRPDVQEYFASTNPFEVLEEGECYYHWVVAETAQRQTVYDEHMQKRVIELEAENARLRKCLSPLYVLKSLLHKLTK